MTAWLLRLESCFGLPHKQGGTRRNNNIITTQTRIYQPDLPKGEKRVQNKQVNERRAPLGKMGAVRDAPMWVMAEHKITRCNLHTRVKPTWYQDYIDAELENMRMEGLLWRCRKLRELEGQRVESLNEQTWTISLYEDSIPCFDTAQVMGGEFYKACITKCDILARSGIVHELDSILLFGNPETLGPMVPELGCRWRVPNFIGLRGHT